MPVRRMTWTPLSEATQRCVFTKGLQGHPPALAPRALFYSCMLKFLLAFPASVQRSAKNAQAPTHLGSTGPLWTRGGGAKMEQAAMEPANGSSVSNACKKKGKRSSMHMPWKGEPGGVSQQHTGALQGGRAGLHLRNQGSGG